MSVQKTVLSLLLAMALALPLAAVESRSVPPEAPSSRRSQVTVTIDPSDVPVSPPRNEPVETTIIELVSQKLSSAVDLVSRSDYDEFISQTAESYGVSPALVRAVIHAESNFNQKAISPDGAVGLMQVMPATARKVGVANPHDPQENIRAGVKYLRELLDMFDHDEALAVAAYNSGPSRVRRYGGVPPFSETQTFVSRVMTYYRYYLDG